MVYIAGDTLHHQPMAASHMTMLQLRGPMGSHVLPWWLFIASDSLCHQPMGTGHMTVLQLCRLMEFRVPAMVSPNASQYKEDKLLYPDHYLVWYAEVDSGPHTSTTEMIRAMHDYKHELCTLSNVTPSSKILLLTFKVCNLKVF